MDSSVSEMYSIEKIYVLMDTVLDGGAFCPDCASTLFISYNRLPVVEGLDPGGHGVHTCALGPSPSLDINSEKKITLASEHRHLYKQES